MSKADALFVIGLSFLLAGRASAASWPMDRSDISRDGRLNSVLPLPLALSFSAAIQPANSPSTVYEGAPVFSSIGGQLFIWAGSSDGRVRAFNGLGQQVWAYQTRGGILAAPAYDGGSTLCVGSADGSLYGLQATSGTLAWRLPLGGTIAAAPLVSGGAAYVASNNGFFSKVTVSTGTILWQENLGSYAWAGAATDGIQIYVAGLNGVVSALAVTDGHTVWSHDLGTPLRRTLAQFGNRLYVSGANGELWALDPASGTTLWTLMLGSARLGSTALFQQSSQNYFIVASLSGQVACFIDNGSAATQVWQSSLGARFDGSVSIDGAHVFIAAHGNQGSASTLYVLDRGNGSMSQSLELPDRSGSSGNISLGDTALYLLGNQGKLLAYAPGVPATPTATQTAGTVTPSSSNTPTPTQTATPSSTSSSTPGLPLSATSSPTRSVTLNPSATGSSSPTPSATPTPTASSTVGMACVCTNPALIRSWGCSGGGNGCFSQPMGMAC